MIWFLYHFCIFGGSSNVSLKFSIVSTLDIPGLWFSSGLLQSGEDLLLKRHPQIDSAWVYQSGVDAQRCLKQPRFPLAPLDCKAFGSQKKGYLWEDSTGSAHHWICGVSICAPDSGPNPPNSSLWQISQDVSRHSAMVSLSGAGGIHQGIWERLVQSALTFSFHLQSTHFGGQHPQQIVAYHSHWSKLHVIRGRAHAACRPFHIVGPCAAADAGTREDATGATKNHHGEVLELWRMRIQ